MNLQDQLLISLDQRFEVQHPPEVGSEHAAGLDCFAHLENETSITISRASEPKLISLGFSIAIPEGWCGILVPRSSTGKRTRLRLANTIGVIDSDYRGPVCALVESRHQANMCGSEMITIHHGMKLCQIVIVPHMNINNFSFVSKLPETVRGKGGFGSTTKVGE